VTKFPKIKILSMVRPSRRPRRTNAPEGVLAWFDVELTGIALRGCALVHSSNGQRFNVWTPSSDRLGSGRAVEFTDHLTRVAVVRAAQDVFDHLGEDEEFHARPA
jgi:hypothetical protein